MSATRTDRENFRSSVTPTLSHDIFDFDELTI